MDYLQMLVKAVKSNNPLARDNHDTGFGCIRNYENEVSMKYNAVPTSCEAIYGK
jgi:hypothetical protein